MEEMANLDSLLGAIAVVILLGGMFMLFGGVSTLGNDTEEKSSKPPNK